ncbi:MAG: proton-conducting membrane transporter [Clostridiales bacterium]|nr:proton-conducting membrane transporter [Clostridiales bacterium]
MLLITVLVPILLGAGLLLLPLKGKRTIHIYTLAATCLTSLCVLFCLLFAGDKTQTFLLLMENMPLTLRLDGMGKVFAALVALLWPFAVLYAFEYMEHEGGEKTFFAWYTVSFGVTLGIAMAGDLITLYLFYEFLTLCTLPLVMHGTSQRSVAAGLKYLYYSMAGAAMAFAGIALLWHFGDGMAFQMGGVLENLAATDVIWVRVGYLLCFLGFGVKAAVFPFHGWLPSASVAPTPVTALLHAVAVVKAGVFAVMRVTFFSFGTACLAGTFAQYVPLALALVTIVYGSCMAVREEHLKRRLAYSTVSNLSYILLGVLLMTREGLVAGMTHMVFHALIKILLFTCVGGVMVHYGKHYVQDIRQLSHRMPLTVFCLVLGSLALTGIPPFIGFTSKWMLFESAWQLGGTAGYLSIAALLISAVLTAVYLLVPSFHACFAHANSGDEGGNCDPGKRMLIPFFVWAALIVILSFASQPLIRFIMTAAQL